MPPPTLLIVNHKYILCLMIQLADALMLFLQSIMYFLQYSLDHDFLVKGNYAQTISQIHWHFLLFNNSGWMQLSLKIVLCLRIQ